MHALHASSVSPVPNSPFFAAEARKRELYKPAKQPGRQTYHQTKRDEEPEVPTAVPRGSYPQTRPKYDEDQRFDQWGQPVAGSESDQDEPAGPSARPAGGGDDAT